MSSSYPVFANPRDFDKDEKAELVNTVIRGQYNSFLSNAAQKDKKEASIDNVISSIKTSASNLSSLSYNGYCIATFDISTSSMTYDTLYPVFSLMKGSVPTFGNIRPLITFVGVDSEESWTDMLNDYGAFVFSYNETFDEQQICFRTFTKQQLTDIVIEGDPPEAVEKLKPIPSKKWRVTMNFHYLGQENEE